ncbi:MAG: hypothetical protein U9N60_06615 [Thermodesulfobacteriota bacterium]|nr:hypothetical protein [Thermodesulfobacteriota bacterium]
MMTEEGVKFIPYEEAKKIIGRVMEEEHIHEPNRRILTVYDKKNDKELCWFDAEEILAEVKAGKKNSGKKKCTEDEEIKTAAVELVMHRIPDWVLEQS